MVRLRGRVKVRVRVRVSVRLVRVSVRLVRVAVAHAPQPYHLIRMVHATQVLGLGLGLVFGA